jgi:hypothetical protein
MIPAVVGCRTDILMVRPYASFITAPFSAITGDGEARYWRLIQYASPCQEHTPTALPEVQKAHAILASQNGRAQISMS